MLSTTRAGDGRALDGAVAPPILIIDDQPEAATETGALLAAQGYALAVEASGDAVLRLVRSRLLRLVVSELYIPCAEGRCVVGALKNDRHRLPRLRVLVLTRHTTPADFEWALDAGADAVLVKPARAAVLLREVGRLLGAAA